MTWSYRVLRTNTGFAIYEVYFDDQGRAVGTSAQAICPEAASVGELREELELLAAALDEPALDQEDLADAAQFMWVFNGDGGGLPSGVFSSRAAAEAWIANHQLTGLLTAYPLERGAYDWAIAERFFTPKDATQASSRFVGAFTSAHLEHFHFEDGARVG